MTENTSQETLALTLKLKILPESQDQVTAFKQTMTTYKDACNIVSQYIFDNIPKAAEEKTMSSLLSAINLQKTAIINGERICDILTKQLGLPSQVTCEVFRSVISNYKTIQMSSSSTFGDMISELANNGITMTLNNGITAIKAVGNVWLKTSDNKIADLLNLGQVSHVTSDIKENSGSSKLEYSETVNALNPAPEQINLQVGIYSDDNSVIVMKLGFALEGINVLRQIGSDTKTDYLSRIDEMLKICNSRQTEMGALQNRLESVLEEISIKYDNLVSSYSTIKDADVAEESSEYIRNQILQQAATTLMATANQTPAIALQLL